MRFLHSKTLELCEFPNHEVIAYAILSHTWGPDEVLFHELDGLNAENTPQDIKQKPGYQKIQACCTQAARDGFEYAWVDTCCIDKRSSAELSEAINSMYRWYQDCAVCYAYLADVPNDVDATTQRWKLEHSRWFTRGWTLQELIAPGVVEFYGDRWISRGQLASLGTQRSLSDVISTITRIPSPVLLQDARLFSYSRAQKMSWAAGRETTREEDRAYSLMGLFNVNMPLLYGEGKRAFKRLQEELMKISEDETLFAWRMGSGRLNLRVRGNDYGSTGFLATSPNDFAQSTSTVQDRTLIGSAQRTTPFSITNMGLRLEVMLLKASDTRGMFCIGGAPFEWLCDEGSTYIIVLNCHSVDSKNLIGITGRFPGGYEKSRPNNQFVRCFDSPNGGLVFLDTNTFQPSDRVRATIYATIWDLGSSDRIDSRDRFSNHQWLRMEPQGFRLVETLPRGAWDDQKFFYRPHNVKLLFDNGVDAFAIYSFLEYGAYLQVQLLLYSAGSSLSEASKEICPREKIALAGDYCDRVSYRLSSGRMVYIVIRPQQVGQKFGYGLYITVDEPQLVYSPPAADVVEA